MGGRLKETQKELLLLATIYQEPFLHCRDIQATDAAPFKDDTIFFHRSFLLLQKGEGQWGGKRANFAIRVLKTILMIPVR